MSCEATTDDLTIVREPHDGLYAVARLPWSHLVICRKLAVGRSGQVIHFQHDGICPPLPCRFIVDYLICPGSSTGAYLAATRDETGWHLERFPDLGQKLDAAVYRLNRELSCSCPPQVVDKYRYLISHQ